MKWIKRLFDLVFSITALTLATPLFLFIAVCIKLSSKGPVFYKSLRVKKGFKLFNCLKFRTMYVDADKRLAEMIATDPKIAREWNTYLKLKDDPRVTPVGRWLRKTSLDELPQFFHVIRGELSVVGPRPYAVMGDPKDYQAEIRRYLGNNCEAILSVKPGITGLWQTSGRNHLPLSNRVHLDLVYISRQSLLLDLVLIAKTVPTMLFAKGAF